MSIRRGQARLSGQAGQSGLVGLHHPAHVPGGQVKRAGPFRVEGAGYVYHVGDVVVFGEACAKEDAPQVDVVGDVDAADVMNGYAEVAGQDLDGHRWLSSARCREMPLAARAVQWPMGGRTRAQPCRRGTGQG